MMNALRTLGDIDLLRQETERHKDASGCTELHPSIKYKITQGLLQWADPYAVNGALCNDVVVVVMLRRMCGGKELII